MTPRRVPEIDNAAHASISDSSHRARLAHCSAPTPLDDAMTALADGRLAAFSTVYELAKPAIARWLRRLGANTVTVEDLTHETLFRVYRARDRYRRGASVLAWARTIARRLYIDRLRDRLQSTVAHAAFYDAMPAPITTRGPDELVAIRRLTRAMNDAVDSLPALQAEAFHLIFEDGLSFAEASAKLGKSQVCLRLRSHRACKALRSALDADALSP